MPIRTLFYAGYPAELASWVMKRQTLLWICHMSRLAYFILFLIKSRSVEKADSALDLPHVKVGLFYTVFKRIIKYIFSTWQDD